MNTNMEQRRIGDFNTTRAGLAPPGRPSAARVDPRRLGVGFGATGVVFYLGCVLTMATVSRGKAVIFFNSLLHGINVDSILKTSVPAGEVVLGLVTTFILGWFAGVLIAGFYNFGMRPSGFEPEGTL